MPKTGSYICLKQELNPEGNKEVKIVDVFREDRPNSPYGLRWFVDRKAKHKFFDSEKARRTFRVKLANQAENEGKQATKLKAWEVRDYLKARDKISHTSLSVLEAVERFLELNPGSESVKKLSEAISEYLSFKEKTVSQAHFRQIKRTLDYFETSFRGSLVIPASDISAWLDGLPFDAQTKRNYRKRLNAFFRYCLLQEWLSKNPISSVASPEVIEKEIGILTPTEASYLFNANLDSPIPALARLALEAFAGLRNSSALRVEFSDIKWDLRGIELPAAKMKTKRRHFIDGLPDNLWKWLEYCRERSTDWSITERNYLHHKTRAFEKATHLLQQEVGGIGEVPHPKNALRHSFASYHVALNKSPGATATILCHKSEKKLWDHYKGKATQGEASGYFSITPS